MNVKRLERATSSDQAASAKEISTKEGPPTSPTLRPSSKIRDRHWQRLAIVYIRQSSPHQVLENRESRERQHALAMLAQQFGWPADRVLVIDEDQGLSGKFSENRSFTLQIPRGGMDRYAAVQHALQQIIVTCPNCSKP
jgi:hypothetical protein